MPPERGGNAMIVGAEGGTRTPTLLRAADFESAASTNSATSARGNCAIMKQSGGLVETQLTLIALIPLVAHGREHRALRHAARIDVQTDT